MNDVAAGAPETPEARAFRKIDTSNFPADWKDLQSKIEARALTSANLAEFFSDNGINSRIPLSMRMAVVDSFLEKAIDHITHRADAYSRNAFIVGGIFVALLSSAVAMLYRADPISDLSSLVLNDSNGDGWRFFAYMTSRLTLTAFVGYGIYISASVAISFFDESLKAYNRRHALRSARLHIWLNEGKVDLEKLSKQFGIGFDDRTAFTKIKPEIVTKGWLSQIVDLLNGNKRKIEELEELIKNRAGGD